MQKNNLKHFFHLHFLVFIAGFTAILGELITNSSVAIVWHRMLIGSVLLGLYMLATNRSFKIDFKLFLKYSFLGLIISFLKMLVRGTSEVGIKYRLSFST